MRYQLAVVAAVCLALGTLFGTNFSNPAEAQTQSGTSSTTARYQMSLKVPGGNTTSTTVFVVDTTTGRCWYRETLGEVKGWTDMGSPHTTPLK